MSLLTWIRAIGVGSGTHCAQAGSGRQNFFNELEEASQRLKIEGRDVKLTRWHFATNLDL